MGNRPKLRRVLFAALGAGSAAAIVFAYYFVPASAAQSVRSVFTGAAAIVARSWTDTFGGSYGGAITEIDIGAATGSAPDASGTEDVPVGGDGFQAFVAPVVKTSSVKIASTKPTGASAAASAPVVVLKIESSTAATAATTATITATSSGSGPGGSAGATSSVPISPHMQCAISTSAALSRKLIFNEIAWMGSLPLAGESGSAAGNREWMELKNISGAALDVAGWQVLDVAGKIDMIFDATSTVPAGGLLLLERGDDAVPNISADLIYTGGLANTGGVLAVVDPACGVSDIVNASAGWPAGNNATKQTLERDGDGAGWHTSVLPGGTPRAENSVIMAAASTPTANNVADSASGPSGRGDDGAVSPPVDVVIIVATTTAGTSTDAAAVATATVPVDSADATTTAANASTSLPAIAYPVIAEVQIAGASSSNDFVKIFNPGAAPADMGGWKLRKKSSTGGDYSLRTFPGGSSAPAGGYFIWANSENGFGDAMGADVTSTATLAADNSVALINADGAVVDAVAWGSGTDQYGEGDAYPANPEAGQVLKRRCSDGATVDTGNNANDFML